MPKGCALASLATCPQNRQTMPGKRSPILTLSLLFIGHALLFVLAFVVARLTPEKDYSDRIFGLTVVAQYLLLAVACGLSPLRWEFRLAIATIAWPYSFGVIWAHKVILDLSGWRPPQVWEAAVNQWS